MRDLQADKEAIKTFNKDYTLSIKKSTMDNYLNRAISAEAALLVKEAECNALRIALIYITKQLNKAEGVSEKGGCVVLK